MAAGLEVPLDPLPESRFFDPDIRCPHPERWHSTDGCSAEIEVGELIAGFVRALQPDLVVETGAAFGITSAVIGTALERNGHGRLVALEIDELRAEMAEAKCAGLPVSIVRESSLEWTPPEPVNVLFSDTEMLLRVPETFRLLDYLPVGSLVIFHDTGPRYGFLRAAIEDELIIPGLLGAPIDLITPRGLTICQRI